jgi:hypothetical protein
MLGAMPKEKYGEPTVPETARKFNAATMIAKDQPNVDPMQFQIHQTRLNLFARTAFV